jgi:hypothetical protein
MAPEVVTGTARHNRWPGEQVRLHMSS